MTSEPGLDFELSVLPPGWRWLCVGDLARGNEQPVLTGPFGSNLGKEDFRERGVPVLTIGCLTDNGIRLDKAAFVDPAKAQQLARYKLMQGDMLFSRMASVGRVGLVDKRLAGALFNYHIMRLRLDASAYVPELFVAYVKGSRDVERYLDVVNHGGTRDGINTSQLLQVPVKVPPLEEQRRIVAKIEALTQKSRRAKEALDAIAPLLERFRQSVLASAFRGDLTKDWRAKHLDVAPIDRVLARVVVDASKTGREATINTIEGRAALAVGMPAAAAPDGWRWVPLCAVARLESGHTPSRRHPEWWGGSVPWIGIKDAGESHGGTIHETQQTTNEHGLANSAARLLPAGTVCLSRTASVGYVVVMGRPMATSQDFANWVCSAALDADFLMYAFLAEGEHLRKFGKGSTHTTIYFPELKAFHICIPPVAEQQEIVRVVRERLDAIARMRATAEQARTRAQLLDPSILAKAFRGELTNGAARE